MGKKVFDFKSFVINEYNANEGYISDKFSQLASWAKDLVQGIKDGLVKMIPSGSKKGIPVASYFDPSAGSIVSQINALGYTFIYASNNSGSLGVVGTAASFVTQSVKNVALGSNATVAASLLALDQITELTNPFDNIQVQSNHFAADLFGYDAIDLGTYTDPISWLNQVFNNLVGDSVALIIRLLFLILGTYMLFRVVDHYLNISQAVSQTVSTVGKVAAL